VIVNYEVLDRHVGWLGDFGFRGMVVDEAHFIKNKNLAALAARAGALRADPPPRHAGRC
jgi:SNF2 family DNA or RNA helicase